MSNKKSSLKEYFRKTYIDKANLIVLFIFVVLILISFFFFKDKFLGYKPIPNYNIPTISQNPEKPFPVETLDLRNTLWEYNTFSGSITNNGKKDVFNLKVRLAVSKTREKWDPEEQVVIIPYEIQSGKTILFSENVTSAGSSDPWWTSNVVDAKYYNGEKIPTPPPIAQIIQVPNKNADVGPWGIAKQVSEHTWVMKVGQDDQMANSQEIFEALNIYRERNGKGRLAWDDNLANFAQSRGIYFNSIRNLDEHKGFIEYAKNIDNLKKLGFWGVGENADYGYKLLGVHLIEWVYAGDKPHNDNQLDPTWTHVGVAVDGLGVSLIFGKWKM